jgi:hypothetical protein
MPVMYLNAESKSLFVNLHEFVLTPGVFERILLVDEADVEEDVSVLDANSADVNEDVSTNNDNCRTGVGGQPSIVSKFPEIVNEVAEFIKQHGFSAQSRRRTETGYSSGLTVKQIQQHLYATYPALKDHKISLSTIRRMFQAPNKHLTAACRYKALVNARVGAKQNSYREFHPDAHFLFARNKMRRELGILLADDISVVSVDDMAKIKVGAPAASRYHQINRIFAENDRPNLKDHDFPVPGYLLTVSGHMILNPDDRANGLSAYDESSSYAVETLSESDPNK